MSKCESCTNRCEVLLDLSKLDPNQRGLIGAKPQKSLWCIIFGNVPFPAIVGCGEYVEVPEEVK